MTWEIAMMAIPWGLLMFLSLMWEKDRKLLRKYAKKEKQEKEIDNDIWTVLERPPREFKYIGYIPHSLVQGEGTRHERKLKVKTLFYMTDDDRRTIVHATKEKHAREYLDKNMPQTMAWTIGGDFPELFVPETKDDVLGKMLSKLIDQKITGQSDRNGETP